MRAALLLVASVLALVGCGKPTNPPVAAEPPSTTDPARPTPGPEPKSPVGIDTMEPAFKLTAEEFHKEYRADSKAVVEKYKGKAVELTGVVEDVGRTLDEILLLGKGAYVKLKIPGDPTFGVMCATSDEQPWLRVARGQKVRIRGLLPGLSFSPGLTSCILMEVGEYAGLRINATDLAKEYAAGEESALKKYKIENLILC